MNINEISVDNWVQVGTHQYYQVEEIRKDGNEYRIYLKGTSAFATLTEVKPISLTPEFLLKNGFEEETDYYGYKVYSCLTEEYQLYVRLKESNYTKGRYSFIHIEYGCISFDELPIDSVHELQNILISCKIEKNIEV